MEVFLPGSGRRGIDPTRGLFCHNAYAPVAHAVAAESVNPALGSFYSAQPAASELRAEVRFHRAG